MAASKSLSPEQNQFARAQLRALIQRKWGGDQSLAATALGVSQPTVSEFLSGAKGIGPKLLSGVMKVDPRVAGVIIGGVQAVDTPEVVAPSAPAAAERVYVSERQEQREAKLSNVRDSLYKRYDRAAVNEAILSEFADGLQGASELEARDRLEEILRLEPATAKGKLQDAQQEPFDPGKPERPPGIKKRSKR